MLLLLFIVDRNSPRTDKQPAFFVLVIVGPVAEAVCTRWRALDLRDQLLSPDRHRVVVHQPCHQHASTPVEEMVGSELTTEIVHLRGERAGIYSISS